MRIFKPMTRIFVFIIGGLLGVYIFHLTGGADLLDRIRSGNHQVSTYQGEQLFVNDIDWSDMKLVIDQSIDFSTIEIKDFGYGHDIVFDDPEHPDWFAMDLEGWESDDDWGNYSPVLSIWIPESVELRIFPLEELEQ